MDGNISESIVGELFAFAREIMQKKHIYPYVSFIVNNAVIVSRGSNEERETRDITRQGDVVAVRSALEALHTGDLSSCTLVSFFEPTILGFDVALWAGIKNFVWCINSSSLPDHYNKMNYSPIVYAKNHPDEITIFNGIRETEALKFVEIAKSKNFYPDNL